MKSNQLTVYCAIATVLLYSCHSNHYEGLPYSDSVYSAGRQQIPGKIFCAYYDIGGEGIAYHDTDSVNHGSGELNPLNGTYLHAFRKDEGVDISYTKGNDIDNTLYNFVAPPSDQLYVGWTEPGEWLKYSVEIKEDGVYSVSLLYTSNKGGKISLSVDDKDVSGLLNIASTFRYDDTENWRQWHHWNISNNMAKVNLKKGFHTLTLHTVGNGQMNYAWLEFEKSKQ
jgi:hypothetical protein